mmetsp:Transcript_21765/g.44750  ORF Transcript_21765/g.44750 Transcript_21765/m.44750 type:complete len:491 (-) Transcript_21765:285-1757(-)|eukprot:CAMPEP_0171345616 /NCGR_PEP_ID=MMETSP0878-20121228/22082_1 /TAXON_ID=67004 /ORGANISM="Thalassiosira weissflogii, Strain CCMP1336" /LENGTH=490 /DNA_ID=CAMNT_0011849077 /DNA_START=98 /DNA_END=1570 /DNA_ORIENTATION=-
MKLILLFNASFLATTVSAFSPPTLKKYRNKPVQYQLQWNPKLSARPRSFTWSLSVGVAEEITPISLKPLANRDMKGLQEWATQYGAQLTDDIELYNGQGADWQWRAKQDIPAGQTVLYVPPSIVLTSNSAVAEFGENLQIAEYYLMQLDEDAEERLPLFRLMVKILAEYEKGEMSIYYSWLNSLPRRFYNGVSMTDNCFECLPRYPALLAAKEKNHFYRIVDAIRQGTLPLSEETIYNDDTLQWAYNVALTRYQEFWEPVYQKVIPPLADLFNHGSNPNVQISFDAEGNCFAYTIDNVPAGALLTVSLGDPTNPTPLFAQYGFLYDDCKTLFCQAIHLQPQIDELGYEYKDLLIQTESGEIAYKVWDIFLYKLLLENDPDSASAFYTACTTNDEKTKEEYHEYYYQYTKDVMKSHVDSIIDEVNTLTAKAKSLPLSSYPRVPMIVAHNELMGQTFAMTKEILDSLEWDEFYAEYCDPNDPEGCDVLMGLA